MAMNGYSIPKLYGAAGDLAGSGGFGSLLNAGGTAAMSAINPISAVAGGVAEVGKGVLGAIQLAQAAKLRKTTVNPGYAIPGAASEALLRQRTLANSQMPGYSQAAQLLASGLAGNRNAIMSSGGGQAERMAALLGTDVNANNSSLQLGAQQEQYSSQQNQNLVRELENYAQWQDNKAEFEQRQPYLAAQDKIAALTEVGQKNLLDSTHNLGALVGGTVGYKKEGATGTETTSSGATKPVFDPKAEGSDYNFDEIQPDAKAVPPKEPRVTLLEQLDPYKSVDGVKSANSLPTRQPSTTDQLLGVVADLLPSINTNGGGTPDLTKMGNGGAYDIVPPKGPYPIGYDVKNRRMMPKKGTPEYDKAVAELEKLGTIQRRK